MGPEQLLMQDNAATHYIYAFTKPPLRGLFG
jgi:hypothetical protein